MSNRINFMGVPVDNLSMEETLEVVDRTIKQRKQILHIVVNAAKIVKMRKDPRLNESVCNADLINADGQAVVWGARILGQHIKERVTGCDLMIRLADVAIEKKYRLFFFGAKEEIVKKVVDLYSQKYSPEIIGGYRNGYYNPEEEESIARQIAQSGSDILFVAITSPKKEIFLYKYRQLLGNVPFIMGVGGSFDVVAGFVKRAPLWMQKSGLEWLYRVYQEPGRMWKRYLVTNTIFIWLVLKNLVLKTLGSPTNR